MPASDPVLVTRDGGVLRLTLNRPARLNALDAAMLATLRSTLEHARDDAAIRAILLTGAGRGFCAGQDLGARDPATRSAPVDLGDSLDQAYNPVLRLIRDLPKPVLCAVNGVAAGAGANLALACDIVLAARSARFIQAFARIGLIPDAGGTWTLVRRLGEARAKALAMTAMPLDADTAANWGLIWKAVDDTDLPEAAASLAAELAQGPTHALGLAKQAMHAAATNDFSTQLDLERDLQRQAGRGADYAEGVRAFLEKRAPRFTGA